MSGESLKGGEKPGIWC